MSATPAPAAPEAPPKRIALLGAGNRGGDVYGEFALAAPALVQVVALADPRAGRRSLVGDRHALPEHQRFERWGPLLAAAAGGALGLDAVVVATPDAEHVEPTVAALALGLDVLLEKPIAPTRAGIDAIVTAERASRGRVTVAHVLRHAPLFATLERLVREGRLGTLVGIDHVEHVGHWHFAHSYVRGNWRREELASSMLLAKACHDLDVLRWLVGQPCRSVASTGGLHHFHAAGAPSGATARCTDGCPVEPRCPYSAPRIYLERFAAAPVWPNTVVVDAPDRDRLLGALRTGPYGRCVYRCDNDVADHQVVALEFEGGVHATLTVTAFSEISTRTLRLWGSHGEAEARMDAGTITLRDFARGAEEHLQVAADRSHRGADRALATDWFERLHRPDTGRTDLHASVESHLMAFAAEVARHQRRVVDPAAA